MDQVLLFCVQNSKVFLLKTQNPEFAILISVDVTIQKPFINVFENYPMLQSSSNEVYS